MIKSRNIIFILLVLFIATTTRLSGLTSESIWLDEAFSVYHAQQPMIYILTLNDPNPPLYMLILSFFVKTFGTDIFWVRLPSVIFGVASVFLIYLLGKKINNRVGLISSLILVFSTYNIFYSQEARAYSLLCFLSLLSFYFFINYFHKYRLWNLLLYFISTTLMLYSHYFAILVLFVQNIFFITIALIEGKYERLKKWFILQLLIAIAYSPSLFNLFNQIKIINNFIWVKGLIYLKFINYNFSGGTFLYSILPLFLLYSLYYFIKNQNRFTKKNKQIFVLLLLWMITPVIMVFICSLIFKPMFLTRYIIFCSIPYYLLIAFAIDKLNKYLRVVIVGVIIIFSLFGIVDQIERIDKTSWKGVSAYVESVYQKDDVIILEHGHYLIPFSYYYSPKCFKSLDLYGCTSNEKIYTIWDNFEKEKNYLNYAKRIIYIKPATSDKEINSTFFNETIAKFKQMQKNTFIAKYNGTVNAYLLIPKE